MLMLLDRRKCMSLAMFFVVRCYREEEEEDTSIVLPLPAVLN